MYTLEGVSSVQTSLLLMKSLNKTETPIFLSVVCSLFPKGNLFDVYYLKIQIKYLETARVFQLFS